MEPNNFLFKSNKGKRTTLDKAYNKHISNIFLTLDDEKESRWETYNVIMQELMNQNKSDYFAELKYRLTDGEDPNAVILDIIEKNIDELAGLIWFLKRRLEEYRDDDYLNRFRI